MLKRDRSSVFLRRHRTSVELLPHDVIELILARLAVKSLVRLRSVSKTWKSTIDSRRFQERQLIRRRQSRGPDVLFVSIIDGDYEGGRCRIVFGSSVFCTVSFPIPASFVCQGSCDGLLCLAHFYTASFVINPITGWHRSFPHSCGQQLSSDMFKRENWVAPVPKLGFGKDKHMGTYKSVCLYNSSEFGLDNITTCEVFDFGTNAWRYLLPASPYRITFYHMPVHLDGSLYWFTECEETKVLAFDLHTECFQVISKTPFARIRNKFDFNMSILDNRLCVSEKNWPTQDIWSFHFSAGWEKICSIDLTKTFSWFGEPEYALIPVAILEKNKLLLHGREFVNPRVPVVIHDLHTKSFDLLYKPTTLGICVCYFQSLLTL